MNTTKELQSLTKFIQSTYTEMDLKIDEVKKQLKKGDNIILAAFGGGFTWGATYIKWAYDTK